MRKNKNGRCHNHTPYQSKSLQKMATVTKAADTIDEKGAPACKVVDPLQGMAVSVSDVPRRC